MNLAIMSDSHDNIPNVLKAMEICHQNSVSRIIHCGDFVSPFMLKEFDKPGIPFHGVLGNNDGNRFELARLCFAVLKNINLSENTSELQCDGIKIGFTHHRNIAEGMALSANYDFVCFGHSHQYFIGEKNNTTLLNPGEIMGKNGSPSFCIINTQTKSVTKYDL